MRRPAPGIQAADLGLAVPWVLGALWVVSGHPERGAVVLAIAAAVTATRIAVGAERFAAAVASIGRRAERVLSATASAAIFAVVVTPAWLWTRVTRQGSPTRRGAQPTRAAEPTRPFGAATQAGPRGRAQRILSRIGLVTALLAVNLLVGLAWEQIAGTDERPFSARVGGDGRDVAADPRVDSPALRGEPWARTHLEELQQVPGGYWPFLLTAQDDFRGETITTSGWERVSYQAPGGGDRPTVMFLGGSTTFGEGQRDEHTIASEVARLAAAAGMPIRAVNVGQRAWVLWQETLLFEQLSAQEPPDIAVFYDGGNDVAAQFQESTAGRPTHYGVDSVARRLTGRPAGGGEGAGPGEPTPLRRALSAYSGHSAAHKLYRFLRPPAQPDPSELDPDLVERQGEPDQVGREAAVIYRRARAVAIDIAARRGITPAFFWHPIRDQQQDESYQVAADAVGAPTIDIRSALDGHEGVYLDAFHTNEEGARIVAARMWEHLRPLVEAAR